ncbi:hypothetical protein HRR80_000701 [Exophiala dermatitidis]|uniref:DUF7908 domain-containing protein n=1 Tax=Exophiala dermatitidis TaxID=5970 RepID=A0AAN6IZM6_EXODE|nr:hypothetical protein HRR82_000779 [Exophiala dermatitidis]KAJ8995953.1 hypothetical protein HRR80_000701 [Exophiala dermatitidis]
MSDGKYVGADSNSSFAALIRSPTLPDAFNAWSFSDNNVTQLDGGVSFCSEGGVVVILLPGDRCATPIALIQTDVQPIPDQQRGDQYGNHREFHFRELNHICGDDNYCRRNNDERRTYNNLRSDHHDHDGGAYNYHIGVDHYHHIGTDFHHYINNHDGGDYYHYNIVNHYYARDNDNNRRTNHDYYHYPHHHNHQQRGNYHHYAVTDKYYSSCNDNNRSVIYHHYRSDNDDYGDAFYHHYHYYSRDNHNHRSPYYHHYGRDNNDN